jgi:hypothetical protein
VPGCKPGCQTGLQAQDVCDSLLKARAQVPVVHADRAQHSNARYVQRRVVCSREARPDEVCARRVPHVTRETRGRDAGKRAGERRSGCALCGLHGRSNRSSQERRRRGTALLESDVSAGEELEGHARRVRRRERAGGSLNQGAYTGTESRAVGRGATRFQGRPHTPSLRARHPQHSQLNARGLR